MKPKRTSITALKVHLKEYVAVTESFTENIDIFPSSNLSCTLSDPNMERLVKSIRKGRDLDREHLHKDFLRIGDDFDKVFKRLKSKYDGTQTNTSSELCSR